MVDLLERSTAHILIKDLSQILDHLRRSLFDQRDFSIHRRFGRRFLFRLSSFFFYDIRFRLLDLQDWKLNILLSEAFTRLQSIFYFTVVTNIIKVDPSLLIKQNVRMVTNDLMLLMLGQLDNLMIIELIPLALILNKRRIMSSIQSAGMQHHSKQIINLIIHFLPDHKVLHVQPIYRIVHRGILLYVRVLPFESLQGNYQDRGKFVNLYLFQSLLV